MYVLLLRPQQQRLKAQRNLVASLDVGDEIITAGGIIGRVVALTDQRASVEVADGVVIDFLRAAVNRKADEATIGSGALDLTDEPDREAEPDDPDGGRFDQEEAIADHPERTEGESR